MQTSQEGIAFLERHEGVVLKAYRDPVGVWTIGAGLTAASGVVKPKAGMKITEAEASKLLAAALSRNYEPAVRLAMPGAEQHEFDGGISFHWNTGAISRASWVKSWLVKSWAKVESGLALWNKGGGKVLPGLERRRHEEYLVIRSGLYAGAVNPGAAALNASVALPLTRIELADIHAAFRTLGYEPGSEPSAIRAAAVVKFQRDHDLTVDAVIGKATLSTLQRRLDAAEKAKADVAAAVVGGGGSVAAPQAPGLDALPVSDWLPWAVGALILAWALWRAWQYRDVLAAKVQRIAPGLARILRSF